MVVVYVKRIICAFVSYYFYFVWFPMSDGFSSTNQSLLYLSPSLSFTLTLLTHSTSITIVLHLNPSILLVWNSNVINHKNRSLSICCNLIHNETRQVANCLKITDPSISFQPFTFSGERVWFSSILTLDLSLRMIE